MTNHDNWLGYLVSVFINQTTIQSKECCPGCHDQKNSPLLHAHHHSGLLEKLIMFHPLVKKSMLSKINDLVLDYVKKFPDPEIYDEAGQKVLRTFGKDYLIQSNPTFIYYSHYLTPELDEHLNAFAIFDMKPINVKRAAAEMCKKQPGRKRVKKQNIESKIGI